MIEPIAWTGPWIVASISTVTNTSSLSFVNVIFDLLIINLIIR